MLQKNKEKIHLSNISWLNIYNVGDIFGNILGIKAEFVLEFKVWIF